MAEPSRPNIDTIDSATEFKRWYWLKEELVAYCKAHKIPYSAGKFELIERVAHYLETGTVPKPRRKKSTSQFDWHREVLTRETLITDSYKNTQNVRRFMTHHIGKQFRFNIAFMAWMRTNVGKSLGDAILVWEELEAHKADPDFQTNIADHNQYNQYLRDFFADNPDLTMVEARRCWEYKRSLPSDNGRHVYDSSDLAVLA